MIRKNTLSLLRYYVLSNNKMNRIRQVPLSTMNCRMFLRRPRRPTTQRLVQSVAVLLEQPLTSYFSSCKSQLLSSVVTVVAENQWKQKMPTGKPFERLPETVKPKHYRLILTPDLKSLTFHGEVSTEIEVGLLHSGGLLLILQ